MTRPVSKSTASHVSPDTSPGAAGWICGGGLAGWTERDAEGSVFPSFGDAVLWALAAVVALQADPVRNRAILDRIPAGRWGDPTDLQGTAVFLASAASNYLQGAIIPVDGGWLCR